MQNIPKSPVAIPWVLTILLSVGLLPSAGAGSLIKWVDENGQVHYGDTVPPEQARHERNVLSDQGVVMSVIERAKTKEELAEERRLARIKAEEERRRAEQAAKDHVLLATFSSEDDMVMTRDGKIAAIDTVIRFTEDRIHRVTQQLQALAHEAAQIERSGKPVPEDLHQQISSDKAEIRHHHEYIRRQREEQEAIYEQFDRDIARFRELRKRVAGAIEDQQ